MTGPAVFLDRDDTLVAANAVAPGGDLGDPSLVRLLPGAADACRRLKDAGFFLAVVTNQGGVARGRYAEDDVRRVHDRLDELLGGVIDDFRFCPFHPKGLVPEYTREHPWRKPAPGMLLDLAGAHGLDLGASWMVGDAPRDAEAGRAAGCRTVLIGPDAGPADHAAPDLGAAADLILRESAR